MADSYLNSWEFYRESSFWTLWAGTIFFLIFGLYMIHLRPRLWSQDFGWTWVVWAMWVIFAVSLWNQHYTDRAGLFTYIFFLSSFTFIFALAAMMFTFCRFLFDRFHQTS